MVIAIETKGLTKEFKGKVAVDHLNLTIEQGELFALLGLNGAGKTTTIRMLCGLSRPTRGDATLLTHSVIHEPYQVKAQINVSPQETAIAPNLTVEENLIFIARVYNADPTTARAKAKEKIDLLKLNEYRSTKARTLSGGWQRRLSIAMALISEPKILFLDEPTLGLDVLARRELWRVITDLKKSITILLTTHYMEEAAALSDRIGVMDNGKLIAIGTVAELLRQTKTNNLEDAFVQLATTPST